MSNSIHILSKDENNGVILYRVMVMFTCMFFIMAFAYAIMYESFDTIVEGFITILKTPAQCTHDAFSISVSSALFNTGFCALLIISYIPLFGKVRQVNASTLAAFFLSVGYGTWGMDIINMLPPMLGIMLVAKLRKKDMTKMVNLGIFSTALSPLLTEVMLRWPYYTALVDGEVVNTGTTYVTNLPFQPFGVVLAIIIGIIIGIVYPAVNEHASKMHLGYSLFNAGPAAGFLCCILVGLLFRTTNIDIPTNGPSSGPEVFSFIFISYLTAFIVCFVIGVVIDKNSLKNYIKLLKDSGHGSNFVDTYGIGATLINIAVYGIFILLFYTSAKIFFGALFNGIMAGIIWGAMTWVAAGAHPLNVLPIGVGYMLIAYVSTHIMPILGIGNDIGRLGMHSVPILIGFAYATGMAPLTGHYGFIAGIVAGIIHFSIVTLTPNLYGGFNYYNGGLAAAIVVFEFVPVLEEYFAKHD